MQPRADARLCDYAIHLVKWWVEGDDEATLMTERWQEDSSANSEDAFLAPVSDSASDAHCCCASCCSDLGSGFGRA